jgi:asparagine synthetase B (glutamine-hydrolysing)
VWAARRGVGPLLGESILHRTPEAYYRAMLGFGPPGEPDPITRCGLPRELEDSFRFRGPRTFAGLAAYSRRMELDSHLDAILTKTDLASMHHGLEVRVPLLDREVVETSLRIAPRLNLSGRRPKAVLEEVFGRLVPGQPHRPDKVGFSFPYREWLRGPLRERTREALCAPWPFELDEQVVRDTWARFDAGDGDAARAVRNLAGLRWWLERVRAEVALSA